MKNAKLVKELETNYENFLFDNVEIIFHLPYGVLETTYHTGTWNDDYPFSCECDMSWSCGEFKTSYHNLTDLIDVLKEKTVSEISNKDFDDIELLMTRSGDVTINKIKWEEKKPSKKLLEDLDRMDLYNNSDINDSEYHIDPGTIDCIEVKLRKGKDTLKIYEKSYEFELGPRIKEWTPADNKKFLKDYTKALIQLKDLQERYNLLVEEGIDDLPKLEDLPVIPEYGNNAIVANVNELRDWKDTKTIQITMWTEHGSAFTFCFEEIAKAVKFRNDLTKTIDCFGRNFSDSNSIEKVWEPEEEEPKYTWDDDNDDDSDSDDDSENNETTDWSVFDDDK